LAGTAYVIYAGGTVFGITLPTGLLKKKKVGGAGSSTAICNPAFFLAFYVTYKLYACDLWTQACNHIAYSPLALSSQLELSNPAGHHLDIVKNKNDIHSSGTVSSSSLKLKQRSWLDLPGHAFGSGQFSTLQVRAGSTLLSS
jgi:hypothetical protein